MNRKLLNGLLVLAVAAGGVGTFTSCKDEDQVGELRLDQIDQQAQINAIRNVADDEFKTNLQAWLDQLTKDDSEHDWNYQGLVSAADVMWTLYQNILDKDYNASKAYVDALYDMMFEHKISSSEWYQDIFGEGGIKDRLQTAEEQIKSLEGFEEYIEWLLAQRTPQISSVGISQTYNPIFGTINLPMNLNSMMVATYLYNGSNRWGNDDKFPLSFYRNLYDPSAYGDTGELIDVLDVLAKDVAIPLYDYTFADPASEGCGNMGHALITINPTNVDFCQSAKNIQVINGKGEVILDGAADELALSHYNDDIYFGISRAEDEEANNGVYALEFNATADNYENMTVRFEDKSELLSAVKGAIKDHTLSDFAHLGEIIYQHMQNILPAYAIRVAQEQVVDGTYDEATDGFTPQTETNYVVSDYKLAAAVVRPFAYTTGVGEGIQKELPIFSPITEYFETYFDKLKKDIYIDLGELGGFDPIDYDGITFKINAENVEINLAGMPVYAQDDLIYDKDGNVTGVKEGAKPTGALGPDAVIYLVFNEDGTVNYQYEADLTDFIKSIEEAVNNDIVAQVDSIIESVNQMITDINKQLGDLQYNINEQVSDILDRIHNAASGKLSYADKLVDLYNKLAARINEALKNPNHYLQVMMAYNAGNGMHHLSTDVNYPTQVSGASKFGKTAGIELFASSYNADILVPSFKKYVAITKAWKNGVQCSTSELVDLNAKAASGISEERFCKVNQVIPGANQRLAVSVADLVDYKVELTYISVDYHGTCSMQQYYVKVNN